MREPPAGLLQDALAETLRAQYGLAVTDLTFLPLGQDAWAGVYRVETARGVSYFLKARRRMTNPASLLVPRFLHDQGIAQVVAPLPTLTHTLSTEVAGYTLILYPFVAGSTGKQSGMTPQQWTALGATLRQIHAAIPPLELAQIVQRDAFVLERAPIVRDLEAHLDEGALAQPIAQALAALWRERGEDICTLVGRGEELGRRLAQQAPEFVVCHTDIHTNNVLVAPEGQVWIVDWDETLLAPKERDLMFVAGRGLSDALVGPGDEEWFFQGYGPTTVDPLGLAYYRYARAMDDIGFNLQEVILRTDFGEAAKRAAIDNIARLFLPGAIIAKALATEIPDSNHWC